MTISQILEEFAYSLACEGITPCEMYIELPKQALDRLSLEFGTKIAFDPDIIPTPRTDIAAHYSYNGFTFRFKK